MAAAVRARASVPAEKTLQVIDYIGNHRAKYCTDFRDTHGSRPLALEAYEDGFNPRTVRNEYGSRFDFVATMGDLTPAEAEVRFHIGAFLGQLEITPMSQALATSFSLPPQLRETGQDMVRELVDWRLTEYLRRTANGRGGSSRGKQIASSPG